MAKFEELRTRYPVFTYEGYEYKRIGDDLHLKFFFNIGETIEFSPCAVLSPGIWSAFPADLSELDGMVFHIGLMELISYWKCTCSPVVHIKPCRLNEEQQDWWRKLYWNGLGEFFYKNGIRGDFSTFMDFTFGASSAKAESFTYPKVKESNRVIVPVGGGKDSVVTLEELRRQRQVAPFIINPRGATLECARIAGFDAPEKVIRMQRTIDPLLIRLNGEGFLNGHTPFSAMLAFYSVLVSAVTGIRDVALSNEASADEPTVIGTHINHQYSKSLEFEQDFRNYVERFMGDANHYFSYLRPFTELQIAEKFARHPQYFHTFKSCNAGSKEDKWCCKCSKCLFAYIILSPFIDDAVMIDIFGEDLLDNPELEQVFDELAGFSAHKPFECVGTIGEVNEALKRILESRKDKYLIKHYINVQMGQIEDALLEDYFNMAP